VPSTEQSPVELEIGCVIKCSVTVTLKTV
jgi:hypothetical protein